MIDAKLAQDVLILEDDEALRTRMVRALTERGFSVRSADNAQEALALARADTPELALLDLRVAGGNGLDVVSELKALDASTRVVVLTGYGSISTAVEAMRRGAIHYLTKPATIEQILAAFDGSAGPLEPASVPSLETVEREHLQRVLNDCGGNVSRAARALGMHRRSLQRKLARFGLSGNDAEH